VHLFDKYAIPFYSLLIKNKTFLNFRLLHKLKTGNHNKNNRLVVWSPTYLIEIIQQNITQLVSVEKTHGPNKLEKKDLGYHILFCFVLCETFIHKNTMCKPGIIYIL